MMTNPAQYNPKLESLDFLIFLKNLLVESRSSQMLFSILTDLPLSFLVFILVYWLI